MISKTITLLCCFFTALSLSAQQKLSLDNIKSISLRNSGTITQAEEIKGYFFYYVSDKVNKKNNEYTIQVMDENLKIIKTIVFEDNKDEQLLETSYDESSLLFMFFNHKKKTFTYKVYDLGGALKYTYVKDLDKKSLNYILMGGGGTLNEENGENKYLHDIPQKGYISVIPQRDGGDYSFEINIYLSDKKQQYTYNPDTEAKISIASFLGSTKNIALFEVLKKNTLLGRKMDSYLLAIDLTTGKKAFEIASDITKYKFLPASVASLSGKDEMLLLGTYYNKEDNVVKDNTLGIAAVSIDFKGKITHQQYNGWDGAISKFLTMNSKGKLDGLGYLFFHKIIQMEDGNIFAVAEGYKRVVSGAGVAMTVLGAAAGGYNGRNSVTRLNITDMVLIQFDNKFQVKSAKIFEKNTNKFDLPGGDYQSPHMMASAAKSMGAYDYEFTRTDNNHSNFTIGYNDYERSKDYKGLTFHSIAYNEGKITSDKINLKSSASSMRIMPAKPGFVVVSEYFKKEKRMDIRMEKLN